MKIPERNLVEMCATNCRNISVNLKIKVFAIAKLCQIFFWVFYFESFSISKQNKNNTCRDARNCKISLELVRKSVNNVISSDGQLTKKF